MFSFKNLSSEENKGKHVICQLLFLSFNLFSCSFEPVFFLPSRNCCNHITEIIFLSLVSECKWKTTKNTDRAPASCNFWLDEWRKNIALSLCLKRQAFSANKTFRVFPPPNFTGLPPPKTKFFFRFVTLCWQAGWKGGFFHKPLYPRKEHW